MKHMKSVIRHLFVLLLAAGLLLPCGLVRAQDKPANDAPEAVSDPGGEAVPEETLSTGEAQSDSYEQSQEKWSQRITSTASYMDTFFDDERYTTTSNRTYIRLRGTPIVDRNGLSFSTYTDIRLLLPNTERWLVNFGGDPDAESRYGSSQLQDQEREDSGRDSSNVYLGVSSFLKRTRTRNVGFGGGVRFRGIKPVPYGSFKWTELWEFNKWDLRAMQRLRYYTDTGPEFKSQLDAEFPIAHKYFARATGSVLFKLNDPTNYYDVDYALYQYLTTRRALKYQITTGYVSEPGRSTYLSTVGYEIEYRMQWRDWFSTSLTPQISQSDTRDWKLDPAIRLDFNFRFGHLDEHGFTSSYTQKQKNNEIKAREDRDKALQEGHEKFLEWKREREEKALRDKDAQGQ